VLAQATGLLTGTDDRFPLAVQFEKYGATHPKRTLVGIAEKSSMLTSLKNAMSDEGP
jgi:hypothetical protein